MPFFDERVNIKKCKACGHPCHCGMVCKGSIGVGMSDKTQPCGCKECKCK
jgi:hypothetical protein